MEWEVRIIEWMQSNLGGFSKVFGNIFAFIGGTAGLTVLLVIVMFCWKKEVGRKTALILTAMSTWLTMIKAVAKRPRPYLQYPDRVKMLAKVEAEAAADDVAAQGYSFPSMHSASVSLLYFSLAEYVKKKWMWILAVILTLLIAYSRVMAGAHYPTDVFAGLLIGRKACKERMAAESDPASFCTARNDLCPYPGLLHIFGHADCSCGSNSF